LLRVGIEEGAVAEADAAEGGDALGRADDAGDGVQPDDVHRPGQGLGSR
jgi:hypothetical protein